MRLKNLSMWYAAIFCLISGKQHAFRIEPPQIVAGDPQTYLKTVPPNIPISASLIMEEGTCYLFWQWKIRVLRINLLISNKQFRRTRWAISMRWCWPATDWTAIMKPLTHSSLQALLPGAYQFPDWRKCEPRCVSDYGIYRRIRLGDDHGAGVIQALA